MADTFVIVEADGGLAGTFDNVVGLDGSRWSVSYLATSVVIAFDGMSIPEPGASCLGLGCLLILLGCRWKHR